MSVSSSHNFPQTDLDMLCLAMNNLQFQSSFLKSCAGLFKKPSHPRQHKAETLSVEKSGPEKMREPFKARRRKSKKARARSKSRAKLNQVKDGSCTACYDRGEYVAQKGHCEMQNLTIKKICPSIYSQ
jgi:hypothetical protein